MSDQDEHMSWCQGDDGDDGCFIEHVISNDPHFPLSVTMSGIRCDHLSIEISRHIIDADELAGVVAALNNLATAFAASRGEVDCDAHNHEDDDEPSEEDDEEDDDGLTCERCGVGGNPMTYSFDGIGQVGEMCGCLAELGYRSTGRFKPLERI